MNIAKIGTAYYYAAYGTKKTEKNIGKNTAPAKFDDSALKKTDSQKSETKSDIIVKPDGSRVLMIMMSIGGMKTTMSMEISKPTEMQNESSNEGGDTKRNMSAVSVSENTEKAGTAGEHALASGCDI